MIYIDRRRYTHRKVTPDTVKESETDELFLVCDPRAAGTRSNITKKAHQKRSNTPASMMK